jgi:hydroxymethylpyrimidine pyrophosphatase-like HAD family hydrolase
MIKFISFDLDGTLTHENKRFDYILWNVEIPKIYAKKNDISLKEAEKVIFSVL